jgi:transcriptional regulator GlxA family with amidase domain
MDRLEEFDVLVVPGGNTDGVLKADAQPIPLIQAYAKLQEDDPSHERTILSVCTGSLFLAKAGILQGLAATTHPNYYTKLEILCQEAARKGELEQTDVMEERYVVNNARFELGENLDENPFVFTARPDGRRKSVARKGSNAIRESMRRESIARRATIRLGGLRVITAGGVSCGLDASLYLVAALVSHESALEVARITQYDWKKGVTVDATDV